VPRGIDRSVDRKRTMIAADLLLAAGLLPLLMVRGAAQVWIIFAVMFWEGAVQQFFSPAEKAMVPRLVPDDQLVTANAVSGQVANVSRLAGSALGGVLAAFGGIIAVTLVDAASFLASAALLGLVRTSGRTASRQGGPVRARMAQVGAELHDGLRLATRHRVLRALMIFALVTSVGEGAMSTLFTPFVERVLHGSPQDLGLIVAAQAIGGIVGGMLAAASGHRGRVFGAVSALEGVTVLAGTLGSGYLSRLAGIIPVLAVQGAGLRGRRAGHARLAQGGR
jgi:predicted MFS family arabinose efflux permease